MKKVEQLLAAAGGRKVQPPNSDTTEVTFVAKGQAPKKPSPGRRTKRL
jgi:hypothetical protein